MSTTRLTSYGLFSGIGGLERGLERAGITAQGFCEYWTPAQTVLTHHWPDVPVASDVRDLRSLPDVDVLTAGWPCTDISQAGRTAGLAGSASGLVHEAFRLIADRPPPWVLLENVRNLLALDGGAGIGTVVTEFERLGYQWAYRLVDSRAFGVPQRRQRVLILASKVGDPVNVLLADEAGPPPVEHFRDDAFGFYWTEGLRGLGWAQDCVPTLKGGSTVGIPSPPGVWLPDAAVGQRLITPAITDVEQLQGFPAGWTEPSHTVRSNGPRWKLVGNAVTVDVAAWVGRRLTDPGTYDSSGDVPLPPGGRWPTAAWGRPGERHVSTRSMWPVREPYRHLRDILIEPGKPLSLRATTGFHSRAERSSLRFDPEFLVAVKEHIDHLSAAGQAA